MEKIVLIAGQLLVEIQCQEAETGSTRTLVKDSQIVLGGRAFKQALYCKSLGTNVILLGRVGNDYHGKMILESLAKAGISSRYIEETDSEHTGLCLQIFTGNLLKYEFFDPGANLGEIKYQKPLEYYLHLCDSIVVNKWCSLSLRKTILTAAKEHSVPCIYVHSGPPDDKEKDLPIDYLFLDISNFVEGLTLHFNDYAISRGIFLFSFGRLHLLSPSGDEVYSVDVPEGFDADYVVAKLAVNLFMENSGFPGIFGAQSD